MTDVTVLPTFTAMILLFLIPPGPDMAYMLAVGLQGGRRAAIKAICGIGTGMSVYAALVIAGVGRVAQDHPMLFNALKLLGATYLAWLAIGTFRTARRPAIGPANAATEHWYARGLLISLTNPKIMLFFLAVLPQFLGEANNITLQLAMLGTVNVFSEMILYGSLGVFAGTFNSRFKQSGRWQTAMNYVAGTVYAVLSLVIFVEVLVK